ncbi:nuclear transport factor 2 family protein [Mycolicibacterium sp. 050232]|uniref:nuclear transport factor 2 family protein n=1 Tax=Mycolicibacterium sp. 050232 TaxID=3113982 RepID=UPI002E299FA7|nr:nuclear transport factor 2 family protein [Mycolicibacterium sp. 050232]MED5812103.1 nuclear transport factor 2 family protein [Mycolicibacterium sp. 050232]
MYEWELSIREAARQLLADYTAATDRFDLRELAACFASDGILEFTGGADPLTGPAAIEAGLGAAMSAPPDATRTKPTFVRHHVSSIRFGAVSTERVEVSSYFAVYTDVGLDHWGRYRDLLVSEEGRWLFGYRRISVDAFAPASLMRSV